MQPAGEYDDGKLYQVGEKIPVHIFNGHQIEVKDVFDF